MKKGIKQAGVATLAVFASAGVAQAADGPSVEELDQRIKVLERQLELQAEDAATKAKDATVPTASDKGFSLKKGDFELKIKGLLQGDARFFIDGANPDGRTAPAVRNNADIQPSIDSLRLNDTFLLRRLRPTFEGTFGKLVGFRLTPEFAGDSATVVDAYIDLKFDPAATVRLGKVKGPLGLERLQSGGATTFIERGFPTELLPNRDLGIQLQGDLFSSTLNYTVGVYNGTPDGRDAPTSDGDDRKEYAARLFAEPFKNTPGFFQGLGFGIAASTGDKSGEGNNFVPRYRTPGQATFFQYETLRLAAVAPDGPDANADLDTVARREGVSADGTHTRFSPQAYFYRNSFGFLGEYASSKQDVSRALAAGGAVEASLEHTAWQAVASYVLTGEDASFRGVAKPSKPYTIGGEGWGAVEVAARYGELEIDEDAFAGTADTRFANPDRSARKASSYGVGVNWYLNSNAKVVVNYTETEFDGGGAGGTDRKDEKALFGRLQLAF